MPAPDPKPGDYIDTYDDEGTVLAVKGGWVYFHSERMGKTIRRLESAVTVCPSPDGIAELKKQIRDSHHGQPRECNPAAGPSPPLGIKRMLERRGNNNHLR